MLRHQAARHPGEQGAATRPPGPGEADAIISPGPASVTCPRRKRGLEAALRRFLHARWRGIDPSPEVLPQSSERNLAKVRAGRLTLTEGGAASLAAIAPVRGGRQSRALLLAPAR